MVVNDVKDYDNLIGNYKKMETKIVSTIYKITLEEYSEVVIEMMSDLKESLLEGLHTLEVSNECKIDIQDNVRAVSESFTTINKARRSNSDVTVYESVLTDLYLYVMGKRKNTNLG